MLEFEILAQGYYRPEQLAVTHQSGWRRMPKDAPVELWLERLWEQKLALAQQNKTLLFDAPLFRLVDVRCNSERMHLLLGDTSYKEYVTTRVPEFARGRDRQELANPLAVCSVVETSDGYILLDQRQGVDVYVGRYHVIGGFFERGLDVKVNSVPDPFAAITREIREETGIQSADIASQHCLGAAYDLTTPHSELCFLTRLNIPLEVVQQQRTPEENEIKQLHTLLVSAESLRKFILQHHGNISATGEPNLLLYGGIRFGEAWFKEILEHISMNLHD